MLDEKTLKTILNNKEFDFIKEKLTEDEIWKFATLVNILLEQSSNKNKELPWFYQMFNPKLFNEPYDEKDNYIYPTDVTLNEPNITTSQPCEEDEADRIIKELEEKGLLDEVIKNNKKINTISEEEKMFAQQPCEDCVSRQAVDTLIDELARAISDERCCISRGRSTATIMRDILHLPSVTPQPRWIPVTEDTPPKGAICLWYNKQGSVFTSEITYRSECNSYVGKHGYFSNGLKNYGDIMAWMPLPQPYKADKEG